MTQFFDDMSCAQDSEPLIFSFAGPSGQVHGRGAAQPVPRGTAETLADRLTAIRAAGGRGVIGGALPFSREDDDYLWQARQISHRAHRPRHRAPAQPRLSRDAGRAVTHALRRLGRPCAAADGSSGSGGAVEVVLARTLAVEADGPIPQDDIFRRIAQDQTVTAFRVMLPDDPQHGVWTGRALIGATPELLIDKAGARISSHPLAGSARRMARSRTGPPRARDGLRLRTRTGANTRSWSNISLIR